MPAQYCLPNVTAGEWYVSAVATADSTDPEPWTQRSLLLGGGDPVTVDDDSTNGSDLALRPRRRTDLPVLYAVPNLEPQVANPEPQVANLEPQDANLAPDVAGRESQVVAGSFQAAASRRSARGSPSEPRRRPGEPPALGNLKVHHGLRACLQSSRIDSDWRQK